jgi:ferrous iron transport protein A
MGNGSNRDRSITALYLSELPIRQRARVISVRGEHIMKKRLLQMGFVRGAEIYAEKVAPLGDPVDFVIKGYHLCLRRDEVSGVLVEPIAG